MNAIATASFFVFAIFLSVFFIVITARQYARIALRNISTYRQIPDITLTRVHQLNGAVINHGEQPVDDTAEAVICDLHTDDLNIWDLGLQNLDAANFMAVSIEKFHLMMGLKETHTDTPY